MESTQQAIEDTSSLESLTALVASLQFQQTSTGRTSFVVTSKGDEVKTGFKVVNANNLVISNNLDGTINPAFPTELQPRDRTRMASKIQVSKIAGNLRPAQLTDSGLSSHGAPIVGPDNVVESGNGRSMGVLRAYEQGQADSYRQYLIDHAEEYGLKAADIERMEMPVLVRERMTDVDRAKFARDSNQSDLQEMAASEKAFVDAEMLDENLMAMFAPSDDGNLLARSNDAFIRAFMREIGDTATAGLVTTDGRPTKQLIDRIQNAIFAKAYKDERLVKMVAEEPDPDMRNILTALNTTASDFAQMQMLSGDVHKETVNGLIGGVEEVDGLDKQAIIALQEAINLVRQAKDNGQALEEVIAQQGLFEETNKEAEALALFIVANNRSAKRIGAAFKKMAQKINDELTLQQQALGDMFGGGSLSLSDVLTAVSNEIEDEFGEGKGLNFAMFESAPDSNDGYISRMISEAKSVDELIQAVRMSGKIKNASKDNEQNFLDLGNLLHFVPKELIRGWMDTYQYSSGVLSTMIATAKNNAYYVTELQKAVEKGQPAPLLNDVRNRPFNVRQFLESAERGENHDRLFLFMHQLDVSIPDSITWDEIHDACSVWVKKYVGNIPAKDFAKISSSLEKKLPTTNSIGGVIALLQKAVSAGDKALADISGVMRDGAAALEAAGVSKDLSSKELADGYTDALERIKVLAHKYDSNNILGTSDQLDFYIEQINKVRDRPEKLKTYLKDVFHASGGLILDVKRLSFIISRESDDDGSIHDLMSMFTKAAYPPKITEDIHRKVQAAFDQVRQSSGVTDEQAKAWADSLELDDVGERTAATKEWGEGYDVRDVAARVFALTGGKLSTLDKIEHQKGVRAYANRSSKSIVLEGDTDSEHVLWHEMGHHIEFSNPHLLERAKAFIKSKAGDRLTYVNFGERNKAEFRVRADVSHYYMSKIYVPRKVSEVSGRIIAGNPALSKAVSTEVFSMAMQCYADQDVAAKSILNGDGIIEFLLGCLKEIQHAG